MTISKDNNSELRSERMQKIIDTHPAFMVRWGTVVIIIAFVLIALFVSPLFLHRI